MMSVTSDHKICDLPWFFFLPRLFHVSALMCNITSKNSCGHRRLNWQQRRGGLSPQVLMVLVFVPKRLIPGVNGLTEYGEIFCGPMSFLV